MSVLKRVTLFATLTAASLLAVELTKTFTPQQRRWWAFQKVVKPAVPAPADSAWVRNDIDAFVLAKLEEKHLSPRRRPIRSRCIRRATLDLTGLLPTPEEVAGLRQRQLARRFRQSGRPPARLAALRRALGAPLAGSGPLRR